MVSKGYEGKGAQKLMRRLGIPAQRICCYGSYSLETRNER